MEQNDLYASTSLPNTFLHTCILCQIWELRSKMLPCYLVLSTLGALATVFTVSFLSSHLLVPPVSFQLLHVSHPSIFSLVVLFSSFRLRVPALFLFPIHLIA